MLYFMYKIIYKHLNIYNLILLTEKLLEINKQISNIFKF